MHGLLNNYQLLTVKEHNCLEHWVTCKQEEAGFLSRHQSAEN